MKQRTFRLLLQGKDLGRVLLAAHKRNISADALIEMLVRHVVRDGLIDAVMDDNAPDTRGDVVVHDS